LFQARDVFGDVGLGADVLGAAEVVAGRVLCTVQNNRYRAETQAIKR
jgi:hypothetical protein